MTSVVLDLLKALVLCSSLLRDNFKKSQYEFRSEVMTW